MIDPSIIIVSGWARSGKDTSINYLMNLSDFYYESTIDPFKRILSMEFDIEYDSKDARHRELISEMKDSCIKYNKNFFIDYFEKKMKNTKKHIITTMREKSELEKFKNYFGNDCLTIKIERPETKDYAKNILEKDIGKNWFIDDFEYDEIIINDGPKEDLKHKIDLVFIKYFRKDMLQCIQ